jgi:uncharacterized membrane protein
MSASEQASTSDTGRLETFADGVLAIAITLLILEVRVPSPAHLEGGSLSSALAEEWPSYAGYVVSFLTLGIIWVNHHQMFKLIRSVTHGFLMLNVIFLMTISFLPFPTALVADYIRNPDGRRTATLVYGATMVAIAIMFNVVWRAASTGRRLLVDGVDKEALARISRSYLGGPIAYGTATLLAFLSPFISLGIFAVMALYWLLPSSGVRAATLLSRS